MAKNFVNIILMDNPAGLLESIQKQFRQTGDENIYSHITPADVLKVGELLNEVDFDATFDTFTELIGVTDDVRRAILASFIFANVLLISMELKK